MALDAKIATLVDGVIAHFIRRQLHLPDVAELEIVIVLQVQISNVRTDIQDRTVEQGACQGPNEDRYELVLDKCACVETRHFSSRTV